MIWPERKEYDERTMGKSDYYGSLDDAKRLGWNACLEACRAAYEKEPKVVPNVNREILYKIICNSTLWDACVLEAYEGDVQELIENIVFAFGIPSLPKNKCIVCEQEACVFQQENGWRCQNHALFGS